jgi:DNA-binding transcriptional regulator YiaG
MRFSGTVYKDGKFWLAEIPILDLMTQGKTKKEAYEMVADMLESLVNKEDFKVEVYKGKKDTFEVGSSEPKHMVSLLLQRKRELSGLSLAQVASKLGMKSRNTYARYEQGRSVPSVEKLNELLNAVNPLKDIVITESTIPLTSASR